MLKKSSFWIFVFLTILILTQMHIFLPMEDLSSFIGLPQWLLFLMGVHVLIVLAIFFLGKLFFNQDNPEL